MQLMNGVPILRRSAWPAGSSASRQQQMRAAGRRWGTLYDDAPLPQHPAADDISTTPGWRTGLLFLLFAAISVSGAGPDVQQPGERP
jgi:hypothetical protein